MIDTTTPKMRTITLTDRPPVKIREDEWLVLAGGEADDDDSNQPGNKPNRKWKRQIRVRQHGDGRVIVYGVYDYDTQFQGEAGAAARRGVLLNGSPTMDGIITAIRRIGDDLREAETEADIDDRHRTPSRWRDVVQACIACLPAQEL